jgi:lipopolysaccharide export system protein LptC
MNTTTQASLMGLGLLMLACLSWYGASSSPTVTVNTAQLAALPDQRITTLQVQQFDQAGNLLHLLNTPLMEHMPLKDIHLLYQPIIKVTEPNQPTWEIRAKEATAKQGAKQITFLHDVLIHQHADAHHVAQTIQTNQITYFPKQKLATTDQKIIWNQSNHQVEAIGMNAYINEHRIDLLNQARAVYAPMHD